MPSQEDWQRGMECWGSVLTVTFGTTRTVGLSALLYMPATLYPQGSSLVLLSVTGWVDARATEWGQAEQVTWKFPRVLPGIKLRTSRLVTQCLDQLHHRLPQSGKNHRKAIWRTLRTTINQIFIRRNRFYIQNHENSNCKKKCPLP